MTDTQNVVPREEVLYIRAVLVLLTRYIIYPPHRPQGTYSVLSVFLPPFRQATNEEICNSVKGLKSKAEICSYRLPDEDLILEHSKPQPRHAGLPALPVA